MGKDFPASVTVFLLCYNDAPTIEGLVRSAQTTLESRVNDWEICVINDASQDQSREIIDRLAAQIPQLRPIHHEKNRDYGGAVRSGFASARKDWVFYTDGDGQYNPAELSLLLDAAQARLCHNQRVDVVNGYKKQRSDSWIRRWIGTAYQTTLRHLFALPIQDVDCDFRLIRRSLLQHLDLRQDSGAITVELVSQLARVGAQFVEVPVTHLPRLHGTSQFFRWDRVSRTLLSLIPVWWKSGPLAHWYPSTQVRRARALSTR